MGTIYSGNVGKWENGGSGDNYIADGYIKTVEKVWIDSATMGTTTLGSDDSIAIAVIPPNKKIIDVVVEMPALVGATSAATVFLDSGATIIYTDGSTYLGSMVPKGNLADVRTFDAGTATTLVLKPGKLGTVTPTGSNTTLYIATVITGGVDANITASTIRSIVRYT